MMLMVLMVLIVIGNTFHLVESEHLYTDLLCQAHIAAAQHIPSLAVRGTRGSNGLGRQDSNGRQSSRHLPSSAAVKLPLGTRHSPDKMLCLTDKVGKQGPGEVRDAFRPQSMVKCKTRMSWRATLTAVCRRSNHAAHSEPTRPRAPIPLLFVFSTPGCSRGVR